MPWLRSIRPAAGRSYPLPLPGHERHVVAEGREVRDDRYQELRHGREAHVTMHVLEGSKEEIEKQLKTSQEAFFEFYPEL